MSVGGDFGNGDGNSFIPSSYTRRKSLAGDSAGAPADEGASIFRREALEHRSLRTPVGDVVRLAPRWTTGAFYLLLVLFAAALIASITIEIDRYASGTTAPEGVVLLPASLVPEVESGNPVDLGEGIARVVGFREEVLYPEEVQERYGVNVAVPSVAVITSASGNTAGQPARVLVSSDPVIVALIPGLQGLFGGG